MTPLRRKMIEDDPAPALFRSPHPPRSDFQQPPRVEERRVAHVHRESLPPRPPALGGLIGRPIVAASSVSQ